MTTSQAACRASKAARVACFEKTDKSPRESISLRGPRKKLKALHQHGKTLDMHMANDVKTSQLPVYSFLMHARTPFPDVPDQETPAQDSDDGRLLTIAYLSLHKNN